MNATREEHLRRIREAEADLKKATSRRRRHDVAIHLRRMRKELADYDRFQGTNISGGSV